jgi:hypothetical protein
MSTMGRFCPSVGCDVHCTAMNCDGLINPFPDAGDFNFCHHVIFVSKPLLSAFFLDVERCCLDGT